MSVIRKIHLLLLRLFSRFRRRKPGVVTWADIIAAKSRDGRLDAQIEEGLAHLSREIRKMAGLPRRKKGGQTVHNWSQKFTPYTRSPVEEALARELECDHAVTLAHLYDTQDLTYGRDWKKDDEELREQGKL